MNVRYYVEARYPFPPGRYADEMIMDTDTDTLPPNLTRAIRERGLEAVLGEWWEWNALGGHVYWRVDPA